MYPHTTLSNMKHFKIISHFTKIIRLPYAYSEDFCYFLHGISALNLRLYAIIPHKNTPCTLTTFPAIMWMWLFVVANAQLTNKMCGEPK